MKASRRSLGFKLAFSVGRLLEAERVFSVNNNDLL